MPNLKLAHILVGNISRFMKCNLFQSVQSAKYKNPAIAAVALMWHQEREVLTACLMTTNYPYH